MKIGRIITKFDSKTFFICIEKILKDHKAVIILALYQNSLSGHFNKRYNVIDFLDGGRFEMFAILKLWLKFFGKAFLHSTLRLIKLIKDNGQDFQAIFYFILLLIWKYAQKLKSK